MMLPRFRFASVRELSHQIGRRLAAAGCLLGIATALRAGPVFVCDPTTLDLGSVAPEAKPVAEFAVRNAGDAPLVLSGVQTGCAGCVSVDIPAGPVPPGTVAMVKVALTKLPPSGPVRKLVRFRTNDPAKADVVLTVNAAVRGAFVLAPHPTFALGDVEAGQRQSWDYELALAGNTPFAIAAIHGPVGIAIQTTLNQPASRHRLRLVTVPEDLAVGSLQGLIALRIDPPAGEPLRVPLSLVVRGPVTPTPSAVLVAIPPADGNAFTVQPFPPPRARLALVATAGPCPPVAAIETPSADVQPQILPATDDARSQTVEVTIRPGARPGRKGDLVIRLAGDGQPRLRVPVIAVPAATPTPPAPPPEARSPMPFPVLASRLAQHLGCSATAICSGGFADERTQLAVWLAERLCHPAKAQRDGRRKALGEMSVIQYARAREEVTLRLRRDPQFKARCEETLAAVAGAEAGQ